jgi:cytidylate kinase
MRRFKENIAKGMTGITFDDVKKDIEYRDRNDSTRAFAPLVKAPDAIEIDSTGRGIEWVVEKILKIIRDRSGECK